MFADANTTSVTAHASAQRLSMKFRIDWLPSYPALLQRLATWVGQHIDTTVTERLVSTEGQLCGRAYGRGHSDRCR